MEMEKGVEILRGVWESKAPRLAEKLGVPNAPPEILKALAERAAAPRKSYGLGSLFWERVTSHFLCPSPSLSPLLCLTRLSLRLPLSLVLRH
jgi:hypothetical protein